MRRKTPFLLFLLTLSLAMILSLSQLAWADDPEEPAGETVEETADPVPPYPAEVETALTAADAITAGLDPAVVSAEVQAQLRLMLAARLAQAYNNGFTQDQLNALATQAATLFGQVDPAMDLPHLNAACQLMIRAMRQGYTAEEAAAMISAKLAAGEDLKTALKETRAELKNKPDKGQGNENSGKPDNPGQGKKNGGGN